MFFPSKRTAPERGDGCFSGTIPAQQRNNSVRRNSKRDGSKYLRDAVPDDNFVDFKHWNVQPACRDMPRPLSGFRVRRTAIPRQSCGPNSTRRCGRPPHHQADNVLVSLWPAGLWIKPKVNSQRAADFESRHRVANTVQSRTRQSFCNFPRPCRQPLGIFEFQANSQKGCVAARVVVQLCWRVNARNASFGTLGVAGSNPATPTSFSPLRRVAGNVIGNKTLCFHPV